MPAVNREKEAALDLVELRNLLSYDPETGIFRWRYSRKGYAQAGRRAGTLIRGGTTPGYWKLVVFGQCVLAHRLAWFHVHGEWPQAPFEVDHINGVRDDNRIANLRLATRVQNSWNSCVRSHNEFGIRNIKPKGNAFLVRFMRKNKTVFHKSCPTLEDAIVMRNEVAQSLYGEFSCRTQGRQI